MNRKGLVLTAVILSVILLVGCGASMTEDSNESGYRSKGAEYSNMDMLQSGNSAPMPEAMEGVSGQLGEGGAGFYEEGRKAIKTAEAQIEVLDFEAAFEAIKSMLGSNGYIEESNIWKTPSYYNGEQIMLTNGNIRLRIKQENFTGFTEGLSTIGTVLSSRAYEDDISDMYYDTEARLNLLRDEKVRLEKYASDVEEAETFFEVQSRITQVIYEMESLQGTLKKWDSKVDYSTVSITINEKHPEEDSAVSKPKGFFEKIWDNMKDSVEFMGDVVILLVGILPVLLVTGAVVIALIVIIKKAGGRKKPPESRE